LLTQIQVISELQNKIIRGEIVHTTDIYTGIYVKNVSKTARIFRNALGAKSRSLQPDMIELTVGSGRLLLNNREMQGPVKTSTQPDEELELGIWVNDVEAVYSKVTEMTNNDQALEIRYVSEIEKKKSGIKDFRFRLAEGYYVRVTGSTS
jgi:hypothetical protein